MQIDCRPPAQSVTELELRSVRRTWRVNGRADTFCSATSYRFEETECEKPKKTDNLVESGARSTANGALHASRRQSFEVPGATQYRYSFRLHSNRSSSSIARRPGHTSGKLFRNNQKLKANKLRGPLAFTAGCASDRKVAENRKTFKKYKPPPAHPPLGPVPLTYA